MHDAAVVRGFERFGDLACYVERAVQRQRTLREFVGETPWAHLDIAGPAFNEKGPYGHVGAGGTGVAVSTLVELARSMSRG